MIDEIMGRGVLKSTFEEVGYVIEEDFPFQVAGQVIHLDGYDPAHRVGYEYVTTASGDRGNLSDAVLSELERLNQKRLVQILLIDELHISSAEELQSACRDYLQELGLGR